MAKLMPVADLPPRPGDEKLSPEELAKFSVFSGVKSANLERYPGAVVLRRYRAGDVVCRQGEPGWTAFYILPGFDLLALRESQGHANGTALSELRSRVEEYKDAEAIESQVAAADPTLLSLDSAAKRARADALAVENPTLSVSLRRLADLEELKAAATVTLTIAPRDDRAHRTRGFFSRLLGRGSDGRSGRPTSQPMGLIPLDGPVDLRRENPIATLHEGELFGEMSCLNRYPRSATVRVTRDCVMIEMLRNVLEVLQKNKGFKEQMDRVYRRRVLSGHLRALPIFRDLDDTVVARLAQRVELIEKEAGEVVFSEGDPSDSLYVIRMGMVKVTQKSPGGTRVLAYRARGEFVGEMGLIRDEPRNATCTALDHAVDDGAKKRSRRVELVRVTRADFDELLRENPRLRAEVEGVAAARDRETAEPERLVTTATGRFDELGLLQGQKLMLIDLERCTRCDECVRACATTHDGRTRLLREGPRFGNFLIPASCRQCLDPVCMIGCPVGSIHKGATGEIIIEDWCIGCEICAKQCPYDAINMHPLPAGSSAEESPTVDVAQRAVVCDQCGSLSDGIPSCVYACPHDAALRVDARAFFSSPRPLPVGASPS